MARNAHRRDQLVMPRRLIVEAIALAVMTDRVDPFGDFDKAARALCRLRHPPVGVIAGSVGFLREGMQNVGEQQFLVLLLVMQADLQIENTCSDLSAGTVSISRSTAASTCAR